MKAALSMMLAVSISGCGSREDKAVPKNAVAPVAAIARSAPANGVEPPEKRASRAFAPLPAPPKPPMRESIDYRAIGTEPFWAVTMRDRRATLERPGQSPAHFIVSRDDGGSAIRYTGEGFAMMLTPGPCSDGMSNALWSDRVQIAYGDGTLKGCGGVRQAARDETMRDDAF